MRNLPRNANFVAEAGQCGFGRLRAGEEFEGDGLIEDEVEGTVNLTHTTSPKETQDPISTGTHGTREEAAFLDGRGRQS